VVVGILSARTPGGYPRNFADIRGKVEKQTGRETWQPCKSSSTPDYGGARLFAQHMLVLRCFDIS
jgi:hypothetical protein